MGAAVPHAWRPPLAGAVVLWLSTKSLLEDRARAQHLMRGCAPIRMSEGAASSLTAAHMINRDNKQLGERCKQLEHIAEHHDKRQTTIGSYPFKCVRKGREQHVPISIAAGQHVRNVLPTAPSPQAVKMRQHSRVGETVGQHALPVLPTAPFPHALKSKKKRIR